MIDQIDLYIKLLMEIVIVDFLFEIIKDHFIIDFCINLRFYYHIKCQKIMPVFLYFIIRFKDWYQYSDNQKISRVIVEMYIDIEKI